MSGRILISLTSMTFCFLRASLLLLLLLVFEFAVIEDLDDRRIGIGGDLDEIETGLIGHAASASLRVTTPTISPRSSTSRTCGTLISSLTRGPSRVGAHSVGRSGYVSSSFEMHWTVGAGPIRAGTAKVRSDRLKTRAAAASSVNLAMASPSARTSCSLPPRRRSATAAGLRLALADHQHQPGPWPGCARGPCS